MTFRIDKKKSKKFYNEIIKKFPEGKVKYYFGEEQDFFKSISFADFLEEDNIFKVNFKNNLEIEFFKILFEKLFINNEDYNFNKTRNEIINDAEYTYIPFKEIDNVRFSNEIKTQHFLPIKENKSEFIFINLASSYDYPDEITDYFIRTMADSLIGDFSSEEVNNFNFFAFFKPIKYLLKIRVNSKDLLNLLKYFLARDMGVCPIEDCSNLVLEFEVDRKVDNIYDTKNNSFLIHPIPQETEAISYYINALREREPFYQFLDFYHILETYCYNYCIDHLIDFLKNQEPYEVFKNIGNLKREEYIISRSIEFICNNNNFGNLKNELNQLEDKINQFIIEINKTVSGEEIRIFSRWEEDEQNTYYYYLGKLIYKLRCEIVHRKIQKNPVTKYSQSYPKIMRILKLIMKKISEVIIDEKEASNDS